MRLDIHKETESRMERTILSFQEELKNVRAGRANPMLLDSLMVSYYGTMTPISQVGTVSAPEPRLLMIQAWDISVVPEIEKAILKSDLGLNPSTDGKVIRLPIPALTEERRKELAKSVKAMAEDAKVAIRNIRRDSNDEIKKMEKDKEISEDDRKAAENIVQEITDKNTKEIESILEAKEAELLEL